MVIAACFTPPIKYRFGNRLVIRLCMPSCQCSASDTPPRRSVSTSVTFSRSKAG